MVKPPAKSLAKNIFTFYTASEYRAELLKHIQNTKPGDRLLLMSMTFEPTEPEIAAIMHETELAASRGVDVTVAIDAHSFLMHPSHLPGPLWPRRTLPKLMTPYYRNKLRILEAIKSYPTGHAEVLNLPSRNFSLPIEGRSHIKAAIINDQIFLGGCNLQGTKLVDMMVGWKSSETSDNLYGILRKVIHGKHAGRTLDGIDRGMPIGSEAELLIDAGVRNQSLIFDEALALIDAAEDWLVITCQFFPNSITAQHLLRASKRGVKVEVIFSHPKHHGLVGGFGQQISILRERTRIPKAMFKDALRRDDPMLHAKLIASDKGVMIGSHNYVNAGVFLGTAEIALKINNEKVAKEAVKTLRRGLKTTQ